MGQLRLFVLLYLRPRKAVAGILDEGRLLFAGLSVVAVSLLTGVGWAASLLASGQAAMVTSRAPATAPARPGAPGAEADQDPAEAARPTPRAPFPLLLPALASGSGIFS